MCLSCQLLAPHFDTARSLFQYTGPAASLVKKFKFGGHYYLGQKILQDAAEKEWLPFHLAKCDTAVPVPLHSQRIRQRGFNQAALLAEYLANRHDLEFQRRALKREKATEQQARLSIPARKKNVKGAFSVQTNLLSGKNVLLVDDVMTTGATADECARMIKKADAESTHVFTLVRANV
ncbi:MAG: ComF family protein [Candidatus Brocadiia bacterium]